MSAGMDCVGDRKLVQRCIAGEERAWGLLVRRYGPSLEHAAARRLSSLGISVQQPYLDEIRGAVFESLLADRCRLLRSFRWECPLSDWLGRLVRTQVSRWLRFQLRNRSPLSIAGLLPFEEPVSPEHEAEQKEKIRRVREALGRLPDRDRSLLTQIYFEERPYRSVAERLGVPLNSVAGWVARAKTRLIALLDDLRLPLL